jgi:hypothetical protein
VHRWLLTAAGRRVRLALGGLVHGGRPYPAPAPARRKARPVSEFELKLTSEGLVFTEIELVK